MPNETPVWDTYDYDAHRRVLSVTAPDNSVVRYSYAGSLTTLRTADNEVRSTSLDDLGRASTITDAKNGPLTFQYDAFGNMYKITDAAGNTNTAAYDIRGNKSQVIDPDLGSKSFI
ncbi:hypothetical protein KY495_06590 [Massilia sp. PAMC28688]|uniref:hypothetical protein n=1 Tax=Massilia sp. PAMC28688 TaxID=2861283 RepID=UPI001C638F44|nr:hypothetical protein [Massilia sp. PAMC28688]QYF94847.1 hypothetical protein KY495_06590 [Massilia sp. PAMC28688]